MEIVHELQGKHQVDAGRCYLLLGDIFGSLGDDPRAQELLELAVELLEKQAPGGYLVEAYKSLAAVRKRHGDLEGALEVLERALSVNERVGRPVN
jgi:tetratricopeptide (TPR) repeat protein